MNQFREDLQKKEKGLKPSKVETAKSKGDFLRGTVDEVLLDPAVDRFEHDDLQLLKFHGTYQQDDRDLRKPRRAEGLDKAYSFMLRVTLPGGKLTASQYLELDRLADDFANGSIRLTTRQAVQFHGVLKTELRETIRQLNEASMTTLSACGDVCRNVMASAPPFETEIYETVRTTANAIAAELRPATKAYHEIWINGERQVSTMEEEPFYGRLYLPRKYKVGVTVMGDNQIDIYSYDAGLIAITEGDKVVGFNVIAGGGLGMSHGRKNTFAQLAHEIGFVDREHGVEAVKAIASIYRDFGNRNDRKQARLKYLIDQEGLDWFLAEFKSRCDFEIQRTRETPPTINEDWLGVHKQNDEQWFYGLFVENGRIKDDENTKIRTAIRRIVVDTNCDITLTPQQSIIFAGLNSQQLNRVQEILAEYGVEEVEELSAAVRYSMACPALPTCGMAVAESERIAPKIMRQIEDLMRSYGIENEPLTFRMTGCPNGCARPYTADVALVGRRPGIYHLFVGGSLSGQRMADLYAADIKIEDLVDNLRPLVQSWAANRRTDEGLGDFYQRLFSRKTARQRVTGKEEPTNDQVVSHLVQLNSNSILKPVGS